MQRTWEKSCTGNTDQWRYTPAPIKASKTFVLLIGLCLSFSCIAQQKVLQGKIVEQVSREPIPYVHIFLTSTQQGTLSDLTGNFIINTSSSQKDSLRFSCIGFKTKKIAVNQFISTTTVVLEEDKIMLPSITIRELTAKEYIRKCVSLISVNYQQATQQQAFYWSSTKHNDRFTDFFESYLRFSKSRSITYDSIPHNVINPIGHIELYDSVYDILSFDVITQASMFVNPANLDDWRYEYLYSSEHQDESFVIIEAQMIVSPFADNKDLNTLKIFINAKNYAIVRIDFTYRFQNGKKYTWQDDVMFALSKLDGTVEYVKTSNQKYSLGYLFIGSEFSFMKRLNPVIFRKSIVNHELVMLSGKSNEKPVVRWSDYLEAVLELVR